jgi:hypothetical protein
MSVLSVELNEVAVATLTASGLAMSDMAKAVNEAVWFAYGGDPDVSIDLKIAAEFDQNRIGVTADEAIAWLESMDTQNPLPTPKPHFIPHD